jgi:predicted AlkP superfamily phosphohydrolase/phosphomutase
MTYPATDVDGRLVAGMMSPGVDADGFAHPPSLADRLTDAVPEYAIGLDWKSYYGRPEEFVADLRDLVAARRAMLDTLVDEDDELSFVVFTAPDRLQHLVWDEATLREQYRLFDEVVGDVIDLCERQNRRLFVVSDHGFGEIDTFVNVNRMLLEEGLFVREESGVTRRLLSATGVSKERVLEGLERVGVTDDRLVAMLPGALVDSVASRVPGDHAVYDMDPERTEAFLHGLGSVYVNDTERFDPGCVPPEDVPAVRAAVRSTLEGLRDPETGDRVLDVYDGTERHSRDDFAPDVVVEGRTTYRVSPSLADTRFQDPGPMAADHRSEGVFLAWGPDVAARATPEDASVVDVAPTVLHAAGEPVPDHADGRVLREIFAPDSAVSSADVQRAVHDTIDRDVDVNVEESGEAVRERLRGLGYID